MAGTRRRFSKKRTRTRKRCKKGSLRNTKTRRCRKKCSSGKSRKKGRKYCTKKRVSKRSSKRRTRRKFGSNKCKHKNCSYKCKHKNCKCKKRSFGKRRFSKRRFGNMYGPGYNAQTSYPNASAPYFGSEQPFVNASNWWYPVGNVKVQSPMMLSKTPGYGYQYKK